MSAAGRRAVTHCQEHTDVPAAWERHVHRASHVAPKQPGLESSRLRCLECLSTDGLSTTFIHDNQPAEAGIVTEWGKLLQRFIDRAIGQWRRRHEWVVPQQGEQIDHLM